MKKITLILAAFIASLGMNAKTVSPNEAQVLAQNYMYQNARLQSINLQLAHTEKSDAGLADYYVFDMNSGSGFIIVSAEDGGHPVIGYSTEGKFVMPSATSNPNFYYWMNGRKSEIEFIRDNNIAADAQVASEWNMYGSTFKLTPPVSTYTVGPLCAAKWDQGNPYNALCPGGSVTGCVATAMAIIMKKWAYPTTGTGSSSYNAGSYGTLSANYGATTYNWAAMTTPYCSSQNGVEVIMSHCGISVEMNYSPQGSGAMVCGQPGAEYSYKTYFKYDPGIHCVMQANDPNWVTDLKNEFNIGQPVQYQGVDASQGGHTWVCDGYDASDNMHMNWGWSGSSNGYYSVNNVAPSGSGLNFTSQLGGLLGIKPMISAALDAGVSAITTPSGTTCSPTFSPVITLKNFGSSVLTSCTINYHVDNNPNQTYSWSGNLASNATANVTLPSMTVSAGVHTFYSSSSSPNSSTDGNNSNDQSTSSFNIATTAMALPLQEGFEASANLPSGWTINNPDNDAAWVVKTGVGKNSSNCMAFNNCDGDAQTDMTGRKDWVSTITYDFSQAASAQMTFDVAYVQLNYQSTLYSDSLSVWASTNCGTTWTNIYDKGGATLATGPQQTATACWAPASANDWRNENISLNSFCGQGSVMFAFRDRSAWGEWIYVDNINITSATGINEGAYANSFNIYPNPASSIVTISGTSKSDKVQYAICNMLGAEIKAGEIPSNGNYNAKISVSDISSGMYFIKVIDGDTSFTKKLNKQ